MLAYLSRYTRRFAISNSRLLACDGAGVAFKYKDYRVDGHARQKVMRLATGVAAKHLPRQSLTGVLHPDIRRSDAVEPLC